MQAFPFVKALNYIMYAYVHVPHMHIHTHANIYIKFQLHLYQHPLFPPIFTSKLTGWDGGSAAEGSDDGDGVVEETAATPPETPSSPREVLP